MLDQVVDEQGNINSIVGAERLAEGFTDKMEL